MKRAAWPSASTVLCQSDWSNYMYPIGFQFNLQQTRISLLFKRQAKSLLFFPPGPPDGIIAKRSAPIRLFLVQHASPLSSFLFPYKASRKIWAKLGGLGRFPFQIKNTSILTNVSSKTHGCGIWVCPPHPFCKSITKLLGGGVLPIIVLNNSFWLLVSVFGYLKERNCVNASLQSLEDQDHPVANIY